jgi:uncharacterized iron-regulated membrane protein
MTIRRIHRLIGLVLLLPFLAWAVTGFIFFVKPGYDDAYEMLQIRTLPLDSASAARTPPGALEVRRMKTVLGDHLLVKGAEGWKHLDPATLAGRPVPAEAELRLLLDDAFSSRPDRYGTVSTVDGTTAVTSTGVTVSLDWERMSLYQRGPDTDRIDMFYKIHYLQWTGIQPVDKVLGVVGLVLVVALSIIGLAIAVRR